MLVILLTCLALWSGQVASQQPLPTLNHLLTPPAIPTYHTPERGADAHWLANAGRSALGAAKRALRRLCNGPTLEDSSERRPERLGTERRPERAAVRLGRPCSTSYQWPYVFPIRFISWGLMT